MNVCLSTVCRASMLCAETYIHFLFFFFLFFFFVCILGLMLGECRVCAKTYIHFLFFSFSFFLFCMHTRLDAGRRWRFGTMSIISLASLATGLNGTSSFQSTRAFHRSPPPLAQQPPPPHKHPTHTLPRHLLPQQHLNKRRRRATTRARMAHAKCPNGRNALGNRIWRPFRRAYSGERSRGKKTIQHVWCEDWRPSQSAWIHSTLRYPPSGIRMRGLPEAQCSCPLCVSCIPMWKKSRRQSETESPHRAAYQTSSRASSRSASALLFLMTGKIYRGRSWKH